VRVQARTQQEESNVVRCLPPTADLRSGTIVFASPLASGGDLFEACKQRALDLTALKRALHGAANGLAEMKAAGFTHCDVKPENVVLDEHGKARLIDFEAAQPAAFGFAGMGTEPYAAPETVLHSLASSKGWTHATSKLPPFWLPAVDVWSLAITIIACWTGTLPWRCAEFGDARYRLWLLSFADPSPQRAVVRRTLCRTTLLHSLPTATDAMCDLLSAMLDPEPSRRPSIEDVCCAAWFSEEM
jgi:serine/threonine protein kinase